MEDENEKQRQQDEQLARRYPELDRAVRDILESHAARKLLADDGDAVTLLIGSDDVVH